MAAGFTPRDEDRPREECGVFAAVSTFDPVAEYIADGLHALQHRGQDSAGIAVSDGKQLMVIRDMGLVADVLPPNVVGCLEGRIGIGHTRYSTTGACTWENAQPCFRPAIGSGFALAHNGNLTAVDSSGERLKSLRRNSSSDTDLVAQMLFEELDSSRSRSLEEAVLSTVPRLEGAFSFVLMDLRCVIGVRDPNGFRPLCLGKLDGGWVLASETAALDTVGALFVREIGYGEMVIIEGSDPPRSLYPFDTDRMKPRLCLLEFVYLTRPDSYLYGESVHGIRMRMGELLARKIPVEADMVIGVPESGIPASEGYARVSGIAWGTGLVKNRYSGRSFIYPTQRQRERAVKRKLSVLREQVTGKRLVVVDDSVIRGTVTRRMIQLIRDSGAREVHLRIALPPVRWPCFYGVDIGRRDELLAVDRDIEEMTRVLGVDSLAFLTVDEMREAIGVPEDGLCDGCLTGKYPTNVSLAEWGSKLVEEFEK